MALASEYSPAKHGFAERVATFVTDLFAHLQKARAFNKAYRELAALPDAQLKDMGLHRSMIRRMAYQAVYES